MKHDEPFQKAKKEFDLILKLYIGLITCSSMSYPIMGLVKPLIDYFNGKLTRESWVLPVTV